MEDLIEAVETIRENPNNHKMWEENYAFGWVNACNAVLELLHAQLTHDRPPSGKDLSNN
jgi:hypothetical protein